MNQYNKKLLKFLYKYFSMKTKDVDRIFTHNELWFANPHYFNDPFDCQPLLTLERGFNKEEYINFVLNNTRDNFQRDLIDVEKQLYRSSAINVFENKDRKELSKRINNAIKGDLNKSINEFRILCLSKNYNDILMWSHYADGHRGFVLQFDEEVLEKNFKQRLYKVFYPPKESYPSIKDFNKKSRVHMYLITKSSHWKYEKEWRIINHIEKGDKPKDKGKIFKFEDGLITGIILGCEIEKSKKYKILKWIDKCQSKPTIYMADKDENSYKIKVDPPIIE